MLITRPDIWTNFTHSVPEYATDAFAAIDPWFYPLMLVGFIGYVYGTMHSAVAAIVAIIITFGLFGATTSIFEKTSELTIFLYIATIVGLTFFIVTLITTKRRGG